jgi:vancomycin resistance protein VanW
MFLHTPLTIVERHAHCKKQFPSQDETAPDGVDATVSEGWLDLKVKNNTQATLQISLGFNETHLFGSIFADRTAPCRYHIVNRNKHFLEKDGRIFEQVTVCRQNINHTTNKTEAVELLYTDEFEIGYSLDEEAGLSVIEENI